MSCGCCIIGSKGMPVEEVITDGVNGLLVDVNDHEKLANRVLALIANPKLRAELGFAARKASLESRNYAAQISKVNRKNG